MLYVCIGIISVLLPQDQENAYQVKILKLIWL